jgi:hypothetical protein
MNPRLTNLFVSAIAIGMGAVAHATDADESSLPPVHTQGAVSYLTGGIGEDEAAAFRYAAARYPLEMLFVQKARPKDEFLADVRVSVRDRSGNLLLETTSEGPFLLARLPTGKYQIDAEISGERKHQVVDIRPGKHQRAVFVWAHRDESDVPFLNRAG